MTISRDLTRTSILRTILLSILFSIYLSSPSQAATSGLPFTEDFSEDNLKDHARTNATWSTDEQETYLAWRHAINETMSNPDTWDVGTSDDDAYAIALGDVDGDGDIDVVVGNRTQTNKLYLNNGTVVPFLTSKAIQIGTDTDSTYAIALGDLDNDGDLDVVAGNKDQTNKLYLNNGTLSPFTDVTGTTVSTDSDDTRSISLGNTNNDIHLDIVTGNFGTTNKIYMNNGSSSPFNGVDGTSIGSADEDQTCSIKLGDVDGDGDLDAVAGNYNYPGGQLNKIYLNNGTSNPFNGAIGNAIGTNAENTRDIALGDVDNDGDLDVVAGNGHDLNTLYLNNGSSPPFSGTIGNPIGTDMDATHSITLGDMDGDGDLDVVVGNNNRANKLYLNNGSSSPFTGATSKAIGADTDGTLAIDLGDVDGDGDLDIVSGNGYFSSQTNKVYLNNGSSLPFTGVGSNEFGADTNVTVTIALGDVDGDGYLDVVEGNNGWANKLYLNDGSSSPFTGISGTVIDTDADNTVSIALGDVDGDGSLDLVTGNQQQPNKLYLNNGSASPFTGGSVSSFGTATDDTRAIALGDMDGDGDMDVVEGNNYWANKLYLNDGSGIPFNGMSGTDIGSADTDRTIAIALGDIDNDGNPDVVAGNYAQANKLYLNDGSIFPFPGVSGTAIGGGANSTYSIALGDMDNDGDLDVVAGDSGQTNKLYLNDGSSTPFAGISAIAIGDNTENTRTIALGDIDGDGDLDVMEGNHSYQTNKIYVNSGSSSLFAGISGVAIGTDTDNTRAIAFGDIDRDGDTDIVAGNTVQAHKIHLNNGSSLPFRSISRNSIGGETQVTTDIALADFDNDGDLDAFTGGYAQANRLYLNSGGIMEPFDALSGTDVGTESENTLSVALADVNQDGHPDAIVGNDGQTNKLYLNDGVGDPFSTLTVTSIGSDANNTYAVAAGDVNQDGLPDVIVGNNGQANRLYLNDGTGDPFDILAYSSIGSDQDNTYAIAVADINRDGLPDVITGNNGQTNKLYLNDGDGDPFDPAGGTPIGSDADNTYAIAIEDINRDGLPDVIAGNNNQTNKLYLNDGSGDPFNTLPGTAIGSSETDSTYAIAVCDLDKDGDPDVVAANEGQANKVYLNDGPEDLFSGITGEGIYPDADDSHAIAIGDVNGDGALDVIVGNYGQSDKLYHRIGFNVSHNRVASLEIDTEAVDNISNATLTATTGTLPINTRVNYFMSNNGGDQFYQVYSGEEMVFPTRGSDLRWKAKMHSLSPILTPKIEQIVISNRNISPATTAGATLHYEEDDAPTPIDETITVSDIDNIDIGSATVTISSGYLIGEDILGFSSANGITGSWDDGSGELTLSGTSSIGNYQAALRSVTYENTDEENPTESDRTISFLVNDGNSPSEAATSTVTVTRTNDAPEITGQNTVSTLEETPRTIVFADLVVYDPDNTYPTGFWLQVWPGDDYTVLGHEITPDIDFIGELTVPVQVSDGDWFSESFDLRVDVVDNTPPVTNASPAGGAYNTAQSVILNCIDGPGTGSGYTIYYTMNGLPPTTSSSLYSDETFNISADTTLKFFAVDGEGNAETIKTESYVIETDAPAVIISYPVDGHAYDHMNSIDGTASDPTTGIDYVELRIKDLDDNDYYNGTDFAGPEAWILASGTDLWGLSTAGVSWEQNHNYEITARATDAAGNTGATAVSFTFGEQETTITCELSSSSITLGESIVVSGCIKSDGACITDLTSAPGLTVELVSPAGAATGITIDSISEGTFEKAIQCEEINMADIVGQPLETWTIQTSWSGDSAYYSGATSDTVPLNVNPAVTGISLDIVASEAIKFESKPPVGGKLTAVPVCSAGDLSGRTVTLTITDPPGGDDNSAEISAITNQNGQFELDYDTPPGFAFNEIGEWTIEADFAGDSAYAAADTVSINVQIVPTAGYAVIIEGMISSEEGLLSHNKTSKFVNETLRERQLSSDDIEYLSWIIGTDDRDGMPTKTNIQNALTASMDKMNAKAGDLYIVMVDHGWTQGDDGVFYLDDETITSTELNTWLTTLQNGLNPAAANQKIVVLLGFCRSGAFIEDISGTNRIIIASADPTEASHRGPKDVTDDGVTLLRDGEYFVTLFFKDIANGKTVKESFIDATFLIEKYTSSGSAAVNAPYFDNSLQHPLLDDNGDYAGSNMLSDQDGEDGYNSELLYIGTSPVGTNAADDVIVTEVCDPRFIGTGDDSVDLWAKVDAPGEVRLIWVEVKAPNYDPGNPGQGVQIEMDTYKDSTIVYNNTEGRYEWNGLDGGEEPPVLFDTPGTYQMFYFVKDDTNGNVSKLVEGKAYKARADIWGGFTAPNEAPNEFGLLSPDNYDGGTKVYTTVVLNWEDTTDPEDDHFTYRVILSKGSECFDETCTDRIVIEDIRYSTCLAVLPEYDWDDSDVYWKVQAIDEYGAVRDSGITAIPNSDVRIFHTDNNNPPMGGWIEGHVIDNTSPTADPVDNAAVNIGATTLHTALGGYYLGVISDADIYTVIADSVGFDAETHLGINISEGALITRDFELNANSDDTDSDGLTDYDELYTCIYDTAYDDADSDDDGILDGDEDANLNGEVDVDETDPGNADTDNDGIQDGTEIGISSPHAHTGGTFIPDADEGATTTDPLDDDTDGDGTIDGDEDTNHNGRVDTGETDPNPMASIPTLNEWGMIVFMILLLAFGGMVIRRQTTEGSNGGRTETVKDRLKGRKVPRLKRKTGN